MRIILQIKEPTLDSGGRERGEGGSRRGVEVEVQVGGFACRRFDQINRNHVFTASAACLARLSASR